MASAGILCRVPSARLLGARNASRMTSTRCLSTLYSNHRPLARHTYMLQPTMVAGSSRNLSLWSSKKPQDASSSAAPQPEPAAFEAEAAAASGSPEALSDSTTAIPTDAIVSQASDPSVASAASSFTETLAALPPSLTPIHYGDLAALGLTGWSPAGLSVQLIEAINVATSLPWFWTIVASTLASRLIILPFAIKQLRNTARLAPYQDRMAALRKQMEAASARKDTLAIQRLALQQKQMYDEAGVSLAGMFATPFVQLPVTLGMFFGMRRLCESSLEQLHHSGVAFLPDLAAVDPYYMLPVLSAVLMNVQLKMGAADMVGGDRQMMTHMINFFRVVSVLGIYIMGSFPVGLNLYVATGIGAMIVQTAVLRVPAVRRLLNIPIVKRTQPVQPVKFSDSIDYVKKYLAEQKALAAKQGARRKF